MWLGLPDLAGRISEANSTDVWPEVYCVSSAVGGAASPVGTSTLQT